MKRFLCGQLVFIFLFSFCNTLFGQETNYKVEYDIEHYFYDRPDDDTDDDDYSDLRISFFTSDRTIYDVSLSFGGPDENGRFTVFDDVITTPNPETSLRYFYDTECPENNWEPFNNVYGLSGSGCGENTLFTSSSWSPCSDFVFNYSRIVELSSSLISLGDNELRECEPFTIEVANCNPAQLSYALEYTVFDTSEPAVAVEQGVLSAYSLKSSSYTFNLADVTELNPSEMSTIAITARYVSDEDTMVGAHRTSVSLTPTACSPQLIPNLTTIENQSCYNITDGEVTLTFDSNIDSANDYQMRYFIFQGTPPTNPSSEDLESENPPFPNQAFADPLGIPLVPAGENFEGTSIGLDGSFTDTNGVTFDTADYYIIYQEVRYDEPNPGDVDVKSAEITPAFTIARPSQIVASGSIEAPQFCGDTAKISFGASGGNNLDSTGSYNYQYRINSTNDADWINISENPQPVALINIEQTVQIRAQYSVNDCFSDAITLTDNIEAAAPDLTLSMPSPGAATSNVIDDGVISIAFGGGTPSNTTPGYTFELAKQNATNGFDIVSVPPSDIIFTGNRIEYRNLGVGTYRITIRDANNCTLTSEDIEVTTIATPELSGLAVTPIGCNNANDATITVNATYPTATTFFYELRTGNTIVRSGDIASTATAPFERDITVSNVEPGAYSLFVKASAGDFTFVSIPEITNPAPLTVSITAVPFSCFDSTDGAISVVASGATNYDYRLSTDLFNWFPLTGSSIPVSIPNFYEVTLRDRDNPSCVSTISNQVEVFSPSEILVTEILANHQNVSTNGGNDGSIEVNVSGGTPFTNQVPAYYNYEWTGPNGVIANSNSNALSGIGQGTYSVEVFDANSCSVNSVDIEITEPGPLSIQPLTGTDTCNGQDNGTITATVQGTGDITFEFLLAPGPGETVAYSLTTPNRTVTAPDLAAGTYGLRITEVTSTTTITTPVADYFTINELAPITATVTPTDLACNETNTGIITITGASGGSNTSFEYAIDDGFGFQSSNTFINLPPNTYVVTVRDDLGCEFITTVDIIQAGVPIVNELTTVVNNASSATSIDGSIVLEFDTDPTNYTYVWTGPGVTGRTTKDLDLIGVGTYQVIVTAPGNCSLTRDFIVGVQTSFSIQTFAGTPTCFNQANGSLTATIVATGDITFNWTLENGTIVASETTDVRTVSTQGLAAGNYYLEIVDSSNQTVQSNFFEIVELAEVSATVVPTASCLGSDTGSISFTNPMGSSSDTYSYSIDNGLNFQANPLFENLAAGSYTPRVRAVENPHCDFIVPGVTITTSPGIFWDEPNTQITRASGTGATDGQIAPAFVGGTLPFTYLWSNSATTQSITGLAAGTYTVTVTDAANCSITQSFEVTEVGPLTISNIIPVDATCRDEANGSITTTVTGEGAITYLWTLGNGDPIPVSNGVNGPNLTGILAGSYILTAIDDNTTLSTAAITISEPATTVTITNIDVTDVSCFGGNDGTLQIQAAGGSGPYTYSLNGGAFQTSPIFTDLFATSYTVRVQDANGCEFTEPTPLLVLEPQELSLIINEQRPVTAANETNGAIFITAEGGSGDYTYQWIGPNGFTSTEEDILNLAAGDYILTITDVDFAINNDTGCRFISTPIAITEPGVLLATLTQTVLLECSGDDFAEITANVQGGSSPYAYQWFHVINGNNTLLDEDTNIIGNLTAGNYFLRTTDANSTTVDTNIIPVTEPNPIEITIDNTTNVICAGQPTGAIDITVSGGTPPYQYFWSNSATVADISGLDAGEYTIDVEDAAGCIAQSSIVITTPDDGVQLTDATITNVSAYQALDGSISLDVTGGSAPYTYVWTRLSDNSNAGNQATISNLAADSYAVSVSDTNDCTITETYEITQPDIVEANLVQPSCMGDSDGSITTLANQGNGTFTYLWNTGATENNISNLAPGSYTVTITGFDDGPLSRTYVLENPVPIEVDLGSDRVLCADQTLELDATVDDATASYSWSSDTGFSSSEPSVVLTETGNYTVTVQSQTGCTAQGTVFVDVSTDEIDAEFAMSSQVFVGETVVAVDISYPLPEGIEWIVPVGAKVESQDKDAVQFSFAEAGEYEITVITTRGDCVAQKTKKIIVVAPDGTITEEDTENGKKLIEDFMVYPNPSSGKFTADVNLTERGNISIKVFSFANNAMMASKKDRGELSYSIPFDLSGLPVGVYAVLLETPYGNTLRKIIIN